MNVKSITLVLIGLLLINLSSALSSDIKQNYAPGETATIKLSGNILESINPNQVEFKRDNRIRVPFQFDVSRLGSDYYLWFIAPVNDTQSNYTLIIHNVATTYLGNPVREDFYQNFSVSGNLIDYTVEPGFASTKDNVDFKITLNKDDPEDIEVDFPAITGVSLNPGINHITISTNSILETQLVMAPIGIYKIPLYIIKNQSAVVKINNSLEINPDTIDMLRWAYEKNIIFNISVTNVGNNKLDNLYLDFNPDYFEVNPNNKISLLPNENTQFQIKLKDEIRYNVSESISIKSDTNNISYNLPVNIEFFINRTIPENISINQSNEYLCSELAGKFCPSANQCNGTFVVAIDGNCCTKGICNLVQDSGSSSWVGYIIIGIAILVLAFVFIRYKKVKPGKNDIEKTLELERDSKKLP